MWRFRGPSVVKANPMHIAVLCAAIVVGGLSAPAWAHSELQHQRLELASGRTVEARIRIPVTAGAAPYPALMLFGGFRGAARVLDAVPQDLPLIVASFDYPFDAPRRFRFPQSFADLPALGRGIDDTGDGIAQLTAHLRARPDVDAHRISIVGASLGAPFAVRAAADLQLPGVILVHGFGDLRRVIAHQFIHKLEPRLGVWVRWPSWGLANALAWGLGLPRPESDARRLGPEQRVLMLNAQDDQRIPRAAVEVLWHGLQASSAHVTRYDHEGTHLRGVNDARIDILVAETLSWMAQERLR